MLRSLFWMTEMNECTDLLQFENQFRPYQMLPTASSVITVSCNLLFILLVLDERPSSWGFFFFFITDCILYKSSFDSQKNFKIINFFGISISKARVPIQAVFKTLLDVNHDSIAWDTFTFLIKKPSKKQIIVLRRFFVLLQSFSSYIHTVLGHLRKVKVSIMLPKMCVPWMTRWNWCKWIVF